MAIDIEREVVRVRVAGEVIEWDVVSDRVGAADALRDGEATVAVIHVVLDGGRDEDGVCLDELSVWLLERVGDDDD